MGQEKSLPVRCNSCHNYSSSTTTAPTILKRSTSRSTASSTTTKKSIALSSDNSISTAKTIHSSRTRPSSSHQSTPSSSYTSSYDEQLKYLNHQLFIKTYLDIIEEERTTQGVHFHQPKRSGIRNYTPKILLDQLPPPPATTLSSSSTSSIEQDDVDVWI